MKVKNLTAMVSRIALTCIAVAIMLMALGFLLGLGPIGAIIALGMGAYVLLRSRNVED